MFEIIFIPTNETEETRRFHEIVQKFKMTIFHRVYEHFLELAASIHSVENHRSQRVSVWRQYLDR